MLLSLLSMVQAHRDFVTVILPSMLGLALALVAGITIHEFSHAFTAYQLGDLTPLYQGRISLNPAAHLDPAGVLLFALAGFGWGRPVQFNPLRLRASPRVASALVAVAGPVSNILLGTVFGLLLRTLLTFDLIPLDAIWARVLVGTIASLVQFNFVLAIFNLVPLPPLDGHHILPALLPPDMAYSLQSFYAQMGAASLMILFLLIWFVPAIDTILFAPVSALFNLVVGYGFF